MKKCECCFLKHNDEMVFNCIGDLSPKECIGRLQGAIDILTCNQHTIPDDVTSAIKINYEVEGAGTIFVHKGATNDEIALSVLEDCDTHIFDIEEC